VRALKGAYDECYVYRQDARDVQLAIINIPRLDTDPNLRVHGAMRLARDIGLDEEEQAGIQGRISVGVGDS